MTTALDLCCGAAGGWSAGLDEVGVETVAACEVVDWRRSMFSANFPKARMYDDLRTLTARQIEADLGYFPDVVVGSPPCKEYSSVNAGAGGLDADDLFLHGVRIVGEGRPRWVGFENSPFVKTRGYDRIADALAAINYTSWPVVVGGGHTGAAHERGRLFIVATDLSRSQGWLAGLPRPNLGLAGLASLDGGGEDVGDGLPRLGPTGTQRLGRHLREYDGVPAGLADQCREAYGDAVMPQLTEAVMRAIFAADAALAGGVLS